MTGKRFSPWTCSRFSEYSEIPASFHLGEIFDIFANTPTHTHPPTQNTHTKHTHKTHPTKSQLSARVFPPFSHTHRDTQRSHGSLRSLCTSLAAPFAWQRRVKVPERHLLGCNRHTGCNYVSRYCYRHTCSGNTVCRTTASPCKPVFFLNCRCNRWTGSRGRCSSCQIRTRLAPSLLLERLIREKIEFLNGCNCNRCCNHRCNRCCGGCFRGVGCGFLNQVWACFASPEIPCLSRVRHVSELTHLCVWHDL